MLIATLMVNKSQIHYINFHKIGKSAGSTEITGTND